MKLQLVDKIEAIEPGERIVTTKALSLAEEYLADHFPTFPVLPGVLMVEAMVQAAAWLIRVQQDFSKSVIVLSSVRNVRYTSFVQPGDILRCEIESMNIDENGAKMKGAGFVDGRQTVSGRLELRSFNLAGSKAYLAGSDREIIESLKREFNLIGGPAVLAARGS